MKKIIIGSTALDYHFPRELRVPKDLDFAVISEYRGEKVEGTEFLYNPVLFKWEDKEVITPKNMLTLKISHLFWDTNWDKHMYDVQFLLDKGYEVNYPMLEELISFWEGYLPKIRRSTLNQTKEEFFTNSVNEDVDEHDKLHQILREVPAYTKILKDGCEVEVDFEKFENLSFQEKLDVVIEEVEVMSTERYSGRLPWYRAYYRQLRDNIMKHYPRPIAMFAILNYKKLLNLRELNIKEDFIKLNYDSREF